MSSIFQPRPFTVIAMVLLGLTLSASPAWTWSSGGHRVVANIAYDRLSPDERSKIVNLIRDEHKDFKKLFKKNMDKELPNASAEDEARWIFLQAAIWPDLIDRNDWHFINFPLFLSETDEMALKDVIKPNLSTKIPSSFKKKKIGTMNCIQAVKYCIREIKDAHTHEDKKAEYYCWLIHVVGDVHQPCHSTALFSRARFNTDEGDRGGNKISTKQAGNLHSYWDGLHGKNTSVKFQPLSEIQKRSKDILADTDNIKAGNVAKKKLNPSDWVHESHDHAKSDVYSKKILDTVTKGEVDPHLPLTKVDLDAAYQKRAQEVADKRVAEAGFRLAELLKQLD